jgi:hypothetical protein
MDSFGEWENVKTPRIVRVALQTRRRVVSHRGPASSRRFFEVDPLLCVCGAEMKILSIITDFRVVDRILRHLRSQACRARDPFEPRAPPQAGGNSLQ